jgi:hypothetical protein
MRFSIKMARARQTNCLCPTLKFVPPSDIFVSNGAGEFCKISQNYTFLFNCNFFKNRPIFFKIIIEFCLHFDVISQDPWTDQERVHVVKMFVIKRTFTKTVKYLMHIQKLRFYYKISKLKNLKRLKITKNSSNV